MTSPGSMHDAVIAGGGHNGLVAAALLGRAGRSVIVLERGERLGGAAISSSPFDGVGVRLSRYAYLVSLFPRELLQTLGVDVELRRRRVSAYTPDGDSGLLVERGTLLSRRLLEDDPALADQWQHFYGMVGRVAACVFGTLTSPLIGREEFRRLVGDDAACEALFERPLSAVLEETFSSDLVRGIVLTDGTIGRAATSSTAISPGRSRNRRRRSARGESRPPIPTSGCAGPAHGAGGRQRHPRTQRGTRGAGGMVEQLDL